MGLEVIEVKKLVEGRTENRLKRPNPYFVIFDLPYIGVLSELGVPIIPTYVCIEVECTCKI